MGRTISLTQRRTDERTRCATARQGVCECGFVCVRGSAGGSMCSWTCVCLVHACVCFRGVFMQCYLWLNVCLCLCVCDRCVCCVCSCESKVCAIVGLSVSVEVLVCCAVVVYTWLFVYVYVFLCTSFSHVFKCVDRC